MAPLNSPKEKLSEQRIKTLTNAARISCQVKGPTIGPNALVDPPEQQPAAADSASAGAAQKPDPKSGAAAKSRWRYDAWRPVNTNDDDDDNDADGDSRHWRPTPTNLTLADCRAVRFSMALKSAEKVQRQIVRQKQAERQSLYDDMITKLEQFRIDSTAKALSAVRAATLEKEERILAAAREFDEQARVDAEQQQRENAEHRRRVQERTERLRRDEEIRGHFESIKSSKNLFIVVFEKLVRTILQNQQTLPNFVTYSGQQNEFLQRYERLLATVNQGKISASEVEQLEQLCEEMQTLQKTIDEEVSENGERLTKMMAEQAAADAQRRQLEAETAAATTLQLDQEQKQQQELERQQHEQQQQQQQQQQPPPAFTKTPPAADAVDKPTANALSTSAQFVHPERLVVHTDVLEFYEQYKLSVKPLQADESMKTYRFNCQKAVNIPLNAISAVNPQHLIDKLDKLCTLLAGGSVQVGTLSVSAAAHPLGVRFCSLLAAKKLVQQADSMISTDSIHAYPIAAIIVAVWQRFPDVGRLCLAYLYKESPYLVPYFIPQQAGQSVEDFLQSLGYRFVDGQLESNELYLKRQTGMVRLYAAIVVSQPRRGQTAANHPHGISNGWVFLAHFMNLDPLPDICATLLYEFLVVAGGDLWRMYGQQFHKLLVVLYQQYLVALSKVDKGGPRARLEQLLASVLQQRRFEEPEGRLVANFW